jgi:formylmethanofuran dehydrogenase subunit E
LREAEDFHGHLGPFLVIGDRAGLVGLMKLGIERGDPKLSVTAMLKNSIPFSCVLDGVQVATGCTIGNKRLRIEDSSKVAIKFENDDGKRVEVEVNSAALDNLIEQLSAENVEAGEVKRLGYIAASIDEHELFRVKLRINSS